MVTDPISDMITRLRNAAAARLSVVIVDHSDLKMAIAEILLNQGFITGAVKKGKKTKKVIEMNLAYQGRSPKLIGISRVSKSSRRIYQKARGLKPVRQGFGELIVSTSRGLMTGSAARQARVGGEVLIKVW